MEIPEIESDFVKTDAVINILNCPFLTLTESKMPNVWYHHKLDNLFALT